ncbi:MAG: hypothetical protein HLUCCA12_02685 [Rhodobacteraceae bacterium HLUCCA12]|nr:MAG: hypothetical protein HLUCCA12_02685 [Rhodobacteraceae bacterium HLUCCA12]
MIRFNLRCDNGHHFFSWFASNETFERLQSADRIECTVCGVKKVEKALMAPAVSGAREKPDESAVEKTPGIEAEIARRIAAYRRHVEENSDYVGMNFVAEARAMHQGEAPERPIYGEARIAEAKALVSEGIPVAPLPFVPKAQPN